MKVNDNAEHKMKVGNVHKDNKEGNVKEDKNKEDTKK